MPSPWRAKWPHRWRLALAPRSAVVSCLISIVSSCTPIVLLFNEFQVNKCLVCSSPVVDNYWAPVEKLQPIPAVPEGGVLPFAPAGMTLGATGPQRLLVGASSIGFRLTNGAPATEAQAAPAGLDRARAADPPHRRGPQPPPVRPQADRPEAAAGGQAPRPHLPDPEHAGDLLARSHDPEPPRPAARPLRRVHPRRRPARQRRDHALGLRQGRPRLLHRKLLRKPRHRHGDADRHQPRTPRRHGPGARSSSAPSTRPPSRRSSGPSAPAKPNGSRPWSRRTPAPASTN